jgi:hypothetical protein
MSRPLAIATLSLLSILLAGCPVLPLEQLGDDPVRYIEEAAYRRGILERDLSSSDNDYARSRLASYGIAGLGWDALPVRDPLSRPLLSEDVALLVAGDSLNWEQRPATRLEPPALPETEAEWVELGRRVFFEYPLRADPIYTELAAIAGGLQQAGFLEDDGAIVGLRLFRTSADGPLQIGNTCAQCHSSVDPTGELSGMLSNREMDIGAAQLLVQGLTPGNLPPELDSTRAADLDRLGPGRGDVLPDGQFDPYAFPDLGGIVDMPFLHHNGNWHNRAVATLAVRCETLFITANSERTRIPRVLTWALSSYFRSLPPPPPMLQGDAIPAAAERGEEVFEEAGCHGCHVPPLYTSAREISVEAIGTDPLAGLSRVRRTGNYRIPSLRGVAHTAPYLHHGAFETLADMFEPGRLADEPGHRYGLDLSEEDRDALLAFLETI